MSSRLQVVFWALQAFCIIMLVMRVIWRADFQKRLAFVGDTLRMCAAQLSHLLLLLAYLTAVQGSIANFLMGHSCESYSTLSRSQHTMFDALVSGSISSCETRDSTEPNREVPLSERSGVTVLITFFTLLNITLLMNFFWTIIGDSLGGDEDSAAERKATPGVVIQVMEQLETVRSRVRGNWPRHCRLQEILEACDFLPEQPNIMRILRNMATEKMHGLLTWAEEEEVNYYEEKEEIYVASAAFTTRTLGRVLNSINATGMKVKKSKWSRVKSAVSAGLTKEGKRRRQLIRALERSFLEGWQMALASSIIAFLNDHGGRQGMPPQYSSIQDRCTARFQLKRLQHKVQAHALELNRRLQRVREAERQFRQRGTANCRLEHCMNAPVDAGTLRPAG